MKIADYLFVIVLFICAVFADYTRFESVILLIVGYVVIILCEIRAAVGRSERND